MLTFHLSGTKLTCSKISRRFISDNFQVGDYVIITPLKKTVTKKQWLSRPLKDLPNAKVNINFGKIPHTDLIGSSPLGKVHTIETKNKLAKYICSKPTLEQWITFSERKAQPIYSLDAQAIVSLTDLHIDYPEPPKEDGEKITPLQFLEAGTGHGSLTLAISKALHPANALSHYSNDLNLRGAVLHTIDCNASHSITGKRTLKGFRRGMYVNNVEFHVSESPSNWVLSDEGKEWIERERVSKKQQELESDPDEKDAFLSGVFLDMPNYHEHMIKLAPFVKTGGFIIVFCPSITQIVDAIEAIATENERLSKLDFPTSLHLDHEKTVQLLDGAGGGLKEWDTRRTLIRATGKVGYSVRPKVGVRTVAGGFVAIWRKLGKDVNLELERELMEEYEPNTVSSEEGISNEGVENLENKESIPTLRETETLQDTKSETVKQNDSRLSAKEKSAIYANDFLSTDPEVFADATAKNELLQQQEENNEVEEQPEIPESDVNPGFKVEEASLIPRSVLHTIHKSSHSDEPDVHVGYITNVYMLETTLQDDIETPVMHKPQSNVSQEQIEEEVNGPAHEEGKPKVWKRHTL